MTDDNRKTLDLLRILFEDQPQLLHAVTLGNLQSQGVLHEVQSQAKLFSVPIFQFAVGRTHAGKTTLGNLLFGESAMRSTGYQDCTDYIGRLRLKSDLCYFDTPGAGGDEEYENFTRMALGLEQVDAPLVTEFSLLDFTDATMSDGRVVGVTEQKITAANWERLFAAKYPPDVIVYVVAPHMLFLRSDREYLRDMLGRHGGRVIIALNRWAGVTKDTDVDNVRRQIDGVYRRAFPDGAIQPRFAEFNAKTGSGIHELTQLICEVVDAEKLGGMQAVLSGDLKEHARQERSRQYRRAVNRIAARLALNTVDQKAAGQDLIAVAASGVSQFGVLTFEADDAAQTFRDELAEHVNEQVKKVQEEQSENIVTRDVTTGTRDIITREPQFDVVETIEKEMQKIIRQVEENTGTSIWDHVKTRWNSGLNQLSNWAEGGTKEERDQLRAQADRDLVRTTTRTVEEEVEVPVRRLEQTIVDYQDKVVATVTEVVDVTERIVGTKALQGGLPVVELLVSVGLGVEAYCTAEGDRGSVEQFVGGARQRVVLTLGRARADLEAMLGQGVTAEARIAELLDLLFAK